MLEELFETDKAAILAFTYQKERENVFIIQALESGHGFGMNRFFGIKENGRLRAVGAYFGIWNSCTANGSDKDVRMIAAALWNLQLRIEAVPAFRTYALSMIDELKILGLTPASESDEIVYEMQVHEFSAHETTGVRAAEARDIDAIVSLERAGDARDLSAPITPTERARANWQQTVVLEMNGIVVAKANLHGKTKRYAQIGGVLTHPAHRGRGYAKRCVSALCERCFSDGTEKMLLFTDKTNLPARAVYEKLGFKPVDRFVIAEYK